ncbi:MAG: hypothetical protein Q9160_002587 [Pyrenula sp. 1 TL-2023]
MATPQSSSTGGGVKNLRAMFETKNPDPSSVSPPSRGRSPAGSDVSNINSSRPVSKVRASFVAVERPGEGQQQLWGLRKASDVSSMAEVKEEAGKEAQIENSAEKSIPRPGRMRNGSLIGSGAKNGNDFALADTEETSTPSRPVKVLTKESPTTNDEIKKTEVEGPKKGTEEEQSQTRANPISDKGAEKLISPSKSVRETKKIRDASDQQTAKGNTKSTPKDASITLKRADTKSNTTSAAGNTSIKSPTTPKSIRTPITPTKKQPVVKGGPNKPEAVNISAHNAATEQITNSEALKRPSQPSLKTHAATKKSTAMTKPSPTSPVANGQNKPASATSSPKSTRPRSPTRPVRLPASATAPTASSAAKTGGARVSTSPPQTRRRSPTRPVRLPASATAPTASSAAKTGTTRSPNRASVGQTGIVRKPSTLRQGGAAHSKPRTSAASLTKQTSRLSVGSQNLDHERPKSRVSVGSKPRDEGFLARMMRPTASSVQKSHEKTEVNSPPRGKGKVATSRRDLSKPSAVMNSGESQDSDIINTKEDRLATGPAESMSEPNTPEKTQALTSDIGEKNSDAPSEAIEEVSGSSVADRLDQPSSIGNAKENDPITATDTASKDPIVPTDPDVLLNAPSERADKREEATTSVNAADSDDLVPAAPKDLTNAANIVENIPLDSTDTTVAAAPKEVETTSDIADEDIPVDSTDTTEKRTKSLSGSTDVEPEASLDAENQTSSPLKENGTVADEPDGRNTALETF